MATRQTLKVIRDEHAVLSAVLRALELLVGERRRRDLVPDYAALRAMLFYIDEFPERIHHPKETDLLFPRLRRRSDELADVLARLDQDHARSGTAVRELEHDLLGLEMLSGSADDAARRQRFETAIGDYVAGYMEHMRLEEREVLPLAERVLSEADWFELDAEFAKDRDPLLHRTADDALRPLFERIVTTLQSPLGLGSAMQALRDSYPSAG